MAYCKICGDENGLTGALRFWSPDDGWIVGRLCQHCKTLGAVKPQPNDYAYESRGEYLSDEQGAIDAIYG